MKKTIIILSMVILFVSPGQARANDDYDELITSLMCPACLSHNEILANGQDAGAEQAKEDIKRRLAAGQTKEEIINAYVALYGEQILAVPDKSGFNLMAWLLPPVALAGGAAFVYLAVRGWVKNHSGRRNITRDAGPAIDPVDEDRLDEEMKKYL